MAITDPKIIESLRILYKKGPAFTSAVLPETATYGSHYLYFDNKWYEMTDKEAAIWENMRLLISSQRLSNAQGASTYIPTKDLSDALYVVKSMVDSTKKPVTTTKVDVVDTTTLSSPVLQMINGKLKKKK